MGLVENAHGVSQMETVHCNLQGMGERYKDILGHCKNGTLRQQVEEAAKLDAAIAANLKELGYGG